MHFQTLDQIIQIRILNQCGSYTRQKIKDAQSKFAASFMECCWACLDHAKCYKTSLKQVLHAMLFFSWTRRRAVYHFRPCLVSRNLEALENNLIMKWEALSRYWFQFMGSKRALREIKKCTREREWTPDPQPQHIEGAHTNNRPRQTLNTKARFQPANN